MDQTVDSVGNTLSVGDYISVDGNSEYNYTTPMAVVVRIDKFPNNTHRIHYQGMSAEHPLHENYCVSKDCTRISEGSSKTLANKNKSTMTLKEKFALAFKGEPQKSFIKAGIMNTDESLTADGKELLLAYLIKKEGDNFKTEVVDPILAVEEDKD